MTTPPTLPALRRRPGTLAVWCVYCDRWHHHGAAGGAGHRVAHCIEETPYSLVGYVLQEMTA